MKSGIQQVREAIEIRIDYKKNEIELSEMMQAIDKSISTVEGLKDWEQDLAFMMTLEKRSLEEWGRYYNISTSRVKQVVVKPAFQELKQKLRYDVRVYSFGMRNTLFKEALHQYLRIFGVRETQFNMETKRKAARELVELFGFGGMPISPDSESKTEGFGAENLEVTVDDLKAEVVKLETLTNINNQAGKYIVEIEEEEVEIADDDVRRVTKGFHKQKAKPIRVD